MTFPIPVNRIILLFTLVVTTGLHAPHFHKDIMGMHSWRQTQTQTNTVSFVEEDGNILHPRRNNRGGGDGIFRMEFPLYQWSAAKIHQVFGFGPHVMRVYLFLLGLLTLVGLYQWLKLMLSSSVLAAIGAWGLAFAPTFFYHSFNPMPDNLALCAGLWGLAFTQRAIGNANTLTWLMASLCLATSALCKLPFILYFAVPALYLLGRIWKNGLKDNWLPLALLVGSGLLPLVWYVSVISEWGGNNIVGGVLSVDYGFARLFGYFQHNLISTLPESLLNFAAVPAFFYGVFSIVHKRQRRYSKYIPYLILGLLLVGFFFYELHALGKAHDYYLYPYLPLLFLFVSYGIKMWWQRFRQVRWRYVLPVLLLLSPMFCYLRIAQAWTPETPGFNADLLLYKERLRAAVPDDALVITGIDNSPFIYLYYLDKKGWAFSNSEIKEEDFSVMIREGASYLYLDNSKLLGKEWMQQFLAEEIAAYGSFKVYRLQR